MAIAMSASSETDHKASSTKSACVVIMTMTTSNNSACRIALITGASLKTAPRELTTTIIFSAYNLPRTLSKYD